MLTKKAMSFVIVVVMVLFVAVISLRWSDKPETQNLAVAAADDLIPASVGIGTFTIPKPTHDELWRLVKKILECNPGIDTAKIKEGDRLVIPPPYRPSPDVIYYQFSEDDSGGIWSMARNLYQDTWQRMDQSGNYDWPKSP